MRILTIILMLSICSCTQTQKKEIKTILTDTLPNIKKESSFVSSDTSTNEQIVKSDTLKNKSNSTNKKINVSYTRMEDGLGDDNFNGKPIIQQLDLASKVLKSFPDTLIELSKKSYTGYTHFFPISIQDNFEEGISTEQIYYPKLTFKFQLFENEYASKPYLEKYITIKKESDGTLTVE